MKTGSKISIAIVVLVAILIIGASVSVHGGPKNLNKNKKKDKNTKLKEYPVDWTLKSGALSDINDFASKKTGFEKEISISKSNLQKVIFELKWTDDKAFIGRIGLDSLSLVVTTPDGKVYEDSAKSVKKAKEGSLIIDVPVNSMPMRRPIIAENDKEAEELLYSPAYNGGFIKRDFNIQISVDVGEILGKIRPRDKGNNFQLSVTYEYYYASLSED